MPYIKGEGRNQVSLFPATIDEYITPDNLVRFIDEYVEQIDVIKYEFKNAYEPTIGRPPYSPKVMLKLYIYGYLNRIRSSRRLEDESKRNLELMWLLEKLTPDFKTIADFRKDNKKALKSIFRDFTKLCRDWDLYGKELVAVDGTKFRASNSKKNNYSQKKIQRHLKYIDEKIKEYLKELDGNDEVEKEDLKLSAEELQEKLDQLKKRKETYEGYAEKLEEEKEISTTDPDSRLMSNNNNSVEVSYNVQTAVDSKNKLIVDFKVTNQPNDFGQLSPMALSVKEFFSVSSLDMLADKGYYQFDCLARCLENDINPYVSKQTHSNATGDRAYYADKFHYNKEKDIYICPEGFELTKGKHRKNKGEIIGYRYNNYTACQSCHAKSRCTKSKRGREIFRHIKQDIVDAVDILTNRSNMQKYNKRKEIVEHPFGTIKRGWGAGYFLTRRIPGVTAEIALSYLAYNMKRAVNIIGVPEMIKRLEKRDKMVLE